MTRFKDFYRDSYGKIKKQVIVKVSDFRSALIQGKFLAKKGIEVAEFRIESGLNCGGHSFPSGGQLLGPVLKEFKEQRSKLQATFLPLIKKFYEANNMTFTNADEIIEPKVTVQGGIGTSGEMERFKHEYDVDHIGIGTPFLFVPEATPIDIDTLNLLINGGESEYYISDASPVGVQFNNLRGTGSQVWQKKRTAEGKPGSPCPKGLLKNNREFTERPICTASTQYQVQKIEQIKESNAEQNDKDYQIMKVLEKECLCEHLGNGSLLTLGIKSDAQKAAQAICPGPNGAWYDRTYTLVEMMDHFYGRSESIVSAERPHVFAKEISMYVDYFKRTAELSEKNEVALKKLASIKENIESGMQYCLDIAKKDAFKDENLASIPVCVTKEQARMNDVFQDFKSTMADAK